MDKLDETITYRGEYRHIKYSITKFENIMKRHASVLGARESDFSWCHYIHINLDKQIKDKTIADKFWLSSIYDDKNRCSYRYYDSIINEIDFHGGCTWYSKESSVDEKDRVVKIGCDYQHSWDTGENYSLDYVAEQARISIDSFLKITPVLVWCSGCGAYYEDVTKNGCGKCQYSKDKY